MGCIRAAQTLQLQQGGAWNSARVQVAAMRAAMLDGRGGGVSGEGSLGQQFLDSGFVGSNLFKDAEKGLVASLAVYSTLTESSAGQCPSSKKGAWQEAVGRRDEHHDKTTPHFCWSSQCFEYVILYNAQSLPPGCDKNTLGKRFCRLPGLEKIRKINRAQGVYAQPV